MRRNSRRLPGVVAAVAALTLVVMAPGSALADEGALPGPLGGVVDSVQDQVEQVTGGASDPVGESAVAEGGGLRVTGEAPAVSSDDDSEGHETEDPQGPDHGGATVLHGSVAGEHLATLGDSHAAVDDDDSTSGDATLLALGGQEIAGAHADSAGEEEAHFGDPLAPLCAGSEGQVCLTILYADAWATDDGATSSSRGETGVADACLGGDGSEDCSGPVSAGVATSESEAERDQRTGRTTAASSSAVADACVQPDPATGACAVGVEVLHSEGRSDSGAGAASAERDSHLLALDLGNEERARVGDPQTLSLPPGCPEGASLLCVFLNQGETYLGSGAAGHAQEALHLDVLPGNLDLVLELARSESLVHADDPEVGGPDPRDPVVRGVSRGPIGPGKAGGKVGGGAPGDLPAQLPQTGGVWSGLVALGLLGVGLGALLTAWSRRRVAESA
ncbi:MAG TPA: LPXTG cell wall anchor domain-containing protein [Nocardioides sp.]|nr:LPXTG cell wall anchor domain-containing protein [Nocardioides sp.]